MARQPFAQVPEDDFQVRVVVEYSGEDEPRFPPLLERLHS